mmetsp:Transcript_28492/g.90087  ORF Transcript_28492/g.90087 Transcript_28492/m.90087 type:complete len:244 (-) Transcript_28492:309-1040(-)
MVHHLRADVAVATPCAILDGRLRGCQGKATSWELQPVRPTFRGVVQGACRARRRGLILRRRPCPIPRGVAGRAERRVAAGRAVGDVDRCLIDCVDTRGHTGGVLCRLDCLGCPALRRGAGCTAGRRAVGGGSAVMGGVGPRRAAWRIGRERWSEGPDGAASRLASGGAGLCFGAGWPCGGGRPVGRRGGRGAGAGGVPRRGRHVGCHSWRRTAGRARCLVGGPGLSGARSCAGRRAGRPAGGA